MTCIALSSWPISSRDPPTMVTAMLPRAISFAVWRAAGLRDVGLRTRDRLRLCHRTDRERDKRQTDQRGTYRQRAH